MRFQRRLMAGYTSFMISASTLLGGYVACGAKSYRVPVHGTEPETETQSTTSSTTNQSGGNTLSLAGVHSVKGWGRDTLIHFSTSVDLKDEVVNELRKAMVTWEKSIGRKIFVYDGVENKKGSDFSTLYAPLNSEINGHYFDYTWRQSTGKSSTVLATTIWENSRQDTSLIVKADIRYNAEFYLFGDALKDFSQGNRILVDMESLALHEVGHLLGLTHVNEDTDRYSVMNPSLFIGEGMTTRRLSKGDIERIRSIYGVVDASQAESLEVADNSPPR